MRVGGAQGWWGGASSTKLGSCCTLAPFVAPQPPQLPVLYRPVDVVGDVVCAGLSSAGHRFSWLRISSLRALPQARSRRLPLPPPARCSEGPLSRGHGEKKKKKTERQKQFVAPPSCSCESADETGEKEKAAMCAQLNIVIIYWELGGARDASLSTQRCGDANRKVSKETLNVVRGREVREWGGAWKHYCPFTGH